MEHISGTLNTRAWMIMYGSAVSKISEDERGADSMFASFSAHLQKICVFPLQMRILKRVIK